MITDFGFGTTGDLQLKSQSNYTDVYFYILGYRSAAAAVVIPEWLGESSYVQFWLSPIPDFCLRGEPYLRLWCNVEFRDSWSRKGS